MANQEEDKRDDSLFGMTLGDGMIEIEDSSSQGAAVNTDDEDKSKDKDKDKSTEQPTHSTYDDGTFEIDLTAKPSESEENEDENKGKDGTHIDKDDEKDKDKPPSDGGQSDSSPSSSPFLAFAKDRASEGVFLDFNDEEWKVLVERNDGDEAAALRELSEVSVSKMIDDGVNAYKESLTDEDRALYEAKEKGLPVTEYATAKRNAEKYSKIKPEDLEDNENLQVELVSKALELKGFSSDEIKEEIEGYKTLENLQDKAEKALVGLPKVYQKKLKDLEDSAAADEESRKDQLRKRVAKMKQMVEQTPEIIPGIKLNKATREKIMKSMTTPVAKDANGQPLNPVMATRAKNPEGFEMMIHYYHQLGLFDIDDSGVLKPDFSKIAKVEQSKATDKMRSVFESKEKQVAGKANIPKGKDDELDDFEAAFGRIGQR